MFAFSIITKGFVPLFKARNFMVLVPFSPGFRNSGGG